MITKMVGTQNKAIATIIGVNGVGVERTIKLDWS